MLNKNYSTTAILFAANVIDGGKQLSDVPASFKADVQELIKTMVGDTKPVQAAAPVAQTPAKPTTVINPTK
ncbi:CD1375 family protein [Lentilactobacillus buchneri]|uniref:CD1375 family protein n=1 Tax=Lentilactobacillus buchneri TaxID=1581 RepID=UPI0021A4D4EA|nr:hypothetical protein [Lentilactobacillus buchneri]MCT2881903.1 hypothetical protein [Lentilactobacillus buchneri]